MPATGITRNFSNDPEEIEKLRREHPWLNLFHHTWNHEEQLRKEPLSSDVKFRRFSFDYHRYEVIYSVSESAVEKDFHNFSCSFLELQEMVLHRTEIGQIRYIALHFGYEQLWTCQIFTPEEGRQTITFDDLRAAFSAV